MKITRLKRGYRIRLSDSEFAALSDACIRADGEYQVLADWEWDAMDPAVVRGLKTISGPGSWAIDEDRRQP